MNEPLMVSEPKMIELHTIPKQAAEALARLCGLEIKLIRSGTEGLHSGECKYFCNPKTLGPDV
jgi:hypothetical protein